MLRVGLARTAPTYAGLTPPFGPGCGYPELGPLLGDAPAATGADTAYAAVRAALVGLGLDRAHWGTPAWNPLRDLVRPGGRVVLKPNFIRHWNPREDAGQSVESVITHGALVRAVADYAFLAVGAEGSVTLAEAPQQDCDFQKIRAIAGLDEIAAFYRDHLGRPFEIIDLRREAVDFRDGIIADRRELPGDPAGYRALDLGSCSFFTGSGLDPERFRGADYDPAPTTERHMDGRNEYLLSQTVLSADLIVNMPKLKTHKKTGVTLALKNMVGINGDKNWLPHHSLGSEREGGDEFPYARLVDRLRSRATEFARPLLVQRRFLKLLMAARRLENSIRGTEFIRAGNWYGNRTTWRMCCDLNRALYYYRDEAGLDLDAKEPVRQVLTVLDGIVAGEGEGPLATDDVPLGVVLAGTDPVAVDLVAIRLMGYDEQKIPKVREAMRDSGPRISAVRGAADVCVGEVEAPAFAVTDRALSEIRCDRPFRPHAGWVGHIEGGRDS